MNMGTGGGKMGLERTAIGSSMNPNFMLSK